jgi:hypothetical protein
MPAKNPKPLTRPRKGEPNHGKFCNAPGSLPPESNLPIQPSLAEQLGLPVVKQSLTTESLGALFPQLPVDATMADRLMRDGEILKYINGGPE